LAIYFSEGFLSLIRGWVNGGLGGKGVGCSSCGSLNGLGKLGVNCDALIFG
jgi:hypothetical protein